MSPDDCPRRPPAPSRYPRRAFAAPLRRPLSELGDRLLAYIVSTVVPAAPAEAGARRRLRPRVRRSRPAAVKRPQRSLRETTQRWNDVLGIWRACDEPGCRRKGRCRGNPLACLPRYLPSVPPSMRLWFSCLGIATQNGQPFGDVLDHAAREGEAAVCARWHATVERALSAGRIE